MGIGNIVLFTQAVFFFLVFFFSFFIFVPLSVNVGDFNGKCLLDAKGIWFHNQSSGETPQLWQVTWGSACNFPIFVGVIGMLIGLPYVIWESVHLARGTDSSWLEAFSTCLVCGILMVIGFAASLTVSSGFHTWCSLLIQPETEITSCENGEFIPFGKKLGIRTDRYFIQLQVSQFGLWSSWFCWVALLMLAIIKIYRYSKQETFLISINRERQRLIQRLGPAQQNV